jgi:hypothetical protein
MRRARRGRPLLAAAAAVALLLVAGAARRARGGDAAAESAPLIVALRPSAAAAGSPDFSCVVVGALFARDSVVHWNGQERPTAYLGPTSLRVQLWAKDVAAGGTAQVTVVAPAASDDAPRVSNRRPFTILPADAGAPPAR